MVIFARELKNNLFVFQFVCCEIKNVIYLKRF